VTRSLRQDPRGPRVNTRKVLQHRQVALKNAHLKFAGFRVETARELDRIPGETSATPMLARISNAKSPSHRQFPRTGLRGSDPPSLAAMRFVTGYPKRTELVVRRSIVGTPHKRKLRWTLPVERG
jgi:hypothetical protein